MNLWCVNWSRLDRLVISDDKMCAFLHKNLSMCRFMPEVSGLLHIFLSLFSIWEALAGLSQPRVAPDENHDWSSVGILKVPQLGVHGLACSSPFCMRASAGGPEPELRSALFNAAAGLASPDDVHHMQKRSRRGERQWGRKRKWTDCLNTSACVRGETEKTQWAFKGLCCAERHLGSRFGIKMSASKTKIENKIHKHTRKSNFEY